MPTKEFSSTRRRTRLPVANMDAGRYRIGQLRMEEEAARIQPLNHGHHRTTKEPKRELSSMVKAAPKARNTAAQAREKPRIAQTMVTKARKAA
jgi:hypothetical protein